MADRDRGFVAYATDRRAMLLRTAYLLCGDAARAEDLVQTALAKLYVAWPRLGWDEPDPYVRRILVNAHHDEHRRPWRREQPYAEPPEPQDPLAAPASDARTVERDAVLRALRQLSPGQRRAVVLRHLWQLSVAEVADELGCSTGTVKSQTADGLRRMRALMGNAHDTDEELQR